MLRRRVFLFCWLSCATAGLLSVGAQSIPPHAQGGPARANHAPGEIRWKTPGKAASKKAVPDAQASADLLAATARRRLVVQFKHLPGAVERDRLRASGVELLSYLGDNSFFANVDGAKGAGKSAVATGLHAAFPVEREWKLHPRLAAGDFPAHARIPVHLLASRSPLGPVKPGDPVDMLALCVVFHPDVALETAGVNVVNRYGGSIRGLMHSINGAVIWLPVSELENLADADEVQWIEPPLPPLTSTNDSCRLLTQAEIVQQAPYGLTGAGINVLVYDGGTALASHVDFGGRLTVRDATPLNDHPTHVAGTIGGSGAASGGLYRGMAPGVTLESFGLKTDAAGLYSNPSDLEKDYDKAIKTYGTVLANNSIGTNVASNYYPCEWEGDYSVTDMMIDAIVVGSLGSPMRIVWAGGNERSQPSRCGTTYRTIAPPAGAKNHIAVGAVNSNDDTMTSFSGWGPVDDGRLKPDICAPGCQVGADAGVTSTVNSGGYEARCGTSMAAPVVTGLVALILEDWKNEFPGSSLPPNATIKTLLVHNAADLETPGPDYQTGYGSVRVQNTINFLRDGQFFQETIAHGEEAQFFIPVVTSGAPLKVTIAWDDPPGALNTAPELVNDLDLKVISPSGTIHYPWTLNPSTPSAPAVRTQADRLNNIEQVMVDSAEAGSWTVIVSGYAIPVGPQAFTIAGSPDLRLCSSLGTLRFSSGTHHCASTIRFDLRDCDLDTDPGTIQTATIHVTSSSDPEGIPVVLSETDVSSGSFTGTVTVSSTPQAGLLTVAHGDVIEAVYIDADDGYGMQDVVVINEAAIDCNGPVVSNFHTVNLTSSSTQVTFKTDEPAKVQISYGLSCGALTLQASNVPYRTNHSLILPSLQENTTYYLAIEAVDQAGNHSWSDNGGACFSFVSADRQNYYTQIFDTDTLDLDGKLITFTPSPSLHKYDICMSTIANLPVDPQGSTVLPLYGDAFAMIELADGKTVKFYGVDYDRFYLGMNGYVTFTSGDQAYSASLYNHFRLPRIAPMFNDFEMNASGRISWQQLPECVVASWERIPEYINRNNSSTFQVVMYFDGTIQLAWAGVDAKRGLVGLSEGKGVPSDFASTDLSLSGPCNGLPAKAFNPRPGDLQPDASVVAPLTWGMGVYATAHEVYFGTAEDALAFQGSLFTNVFAPPLLSNRTTYFWRVDEVNAEGVAVGDIWSFTTKQLRADFDQDGDVDMTDFAHLQICLTGPGVPQNDPECQDAKLDGDEDVDENDVNIFYGCLSGPNREANGGCLP